jgi:hypothetical protein
VYCSRDFPARYHPWEPYGHSMPIGGAGVRMGGAVALVQLGGPAGLVSQPGTDHPYQGMDPSDPSTFVRRYNPAPGMIAYLNFDGAQPNVTQTTGGPPRKWGRGSRGRG